MMCNKERSSCGLCGCLSKMTCLGGPARDSRVMPKPLKGAGVKLTRLAQIQIQVAKGCTWRHMAYQNLPGLGQVMSVPIFLGLSRLVPCGTLRCICEPSSSRTKHDTSTLDWVPRDVGVSATVGLVPSPSCPIFQVSGGCAGALQPCPYASL